MDRENLADLLELRIDAVFERWKAAVESSPAPGDRLEAELAAEVPSFLRQIVATLRGQAAPAAAASGERGARRFRSGFQLEQVVREYGQLMHAVLDLVEAAAIREVRQLHDLFTRAVAEATAEHVRRLSVQESTSRAAREQAGTDRGRLLAEVEAARRRAEARRQELAVLFDRARWPSPLFAGPPTSSSWRTLGSAASGAGGAQRSSTSLSSKRCRVGGTRTGSSTARGPVIRPSLRRQGASRSGGPR